MTRYSLDSEESPDKAKAFKDALGYEKQHAMELIENAEKNINEYSMKMRGDDGHGDKFSITMNLHGRNGKSAKILSSLIKDKKNGEVRLTSIYVDESRGGSKMKYNMFDRVLLKTGETAYIVEIYDNGDYEIEVIPSDKEYRLRTVKPEEIDRFIGIEDLKH